MAKRKNKTRTNSPIKLIIVLFFLLFTAIITISSNTPARFFTFGNVNPDSYFSPEPAKNSIQLYSFPNVEDITPPAGNNPTVALVPPASSSNNPPSSSSCGIASPILETGTENGKCCVQDGPVNNPSECCSGVPYCDLTQKPPVGSPGITCSCSDSGSGPVVAQAANGGNQQAFSGTCGDYPYWCNAKPVIYLYPLQKTNVSVKVKVPGTIFISIPEYPAEGWKDVTAYPDGTLYYQGKKYGDLYYESTITPISPPDTGIITARTNIYQRLREITTRLGLNTKEQEDFLEYWYPRLQELNKPFIQISVFSPEAKETIDQVDISPKPDTFIQFIMYYKGLDYPASVKPIILPADIPERIGFTAVEWGGIIDD